MSTRVLPEEWYSLVDVPRALYKSHPSYGHACSFPCDTHPNKLATGMMQTPDHRAIAICDECRYEIRKVQRQPLPPSPPATFDEVNE